MEIAHGKLLAVALTFVAGSAHDVLGPDLGEAVESTLRQRFSIQGGAAVDPYHSDEVDPRGWVALQRRVPAIAGIDAYQAVFVTAPMRTIEALTVPKLADPFHVASLETLVEGLQAFADSASLPTDEVELMQLAARYLEEDELVEADLDVQTYVQLMLSARQASARRQPLWIV
ncbi:MAG TPA: hypothetical protein VKH35_02385 [Thermoanaerobaculia bacterium]|nr:hypothetical protein [Thermoanaerobaculia bacterium]